MSCYKSKHSQSDDVRAKIRKAFGVLRKAGYFARMNFWCCQSCAWYDVPKEKAMKVVFFHSQDNDDLKDRAACHIAWASPDPKFVVKTLEDSGLKVDWDGSEGKRFFVHN